MFSKLSYSEVGVHSVFCVYHLVLCLISGSLFPRLQALYTEEGRIMTPNDVRNPNAGRCEYVLLQGKKHCAGMIKLRTLTWGEYPRSSVRV